MLYIYISISIYVIYIHIYVYIYIYWERYRYIDIHDFQQCETIRFGESIYTQKASIVET